MTVRPRRSALFMPGSDANAHEAAKTLAADTLIFDLGDAIPPDVKDSARAHMARSLKRGGYGARECVVRVNERDTPWGLGDVAAAVSAGADAILVPKIDCPGDIMRAAKDLRDAGASSAVRLWAMIETPTAILNLDSIMRTAADPSSRLDVVVVGTQNLARETRARLTNGRAGLLAYLSLAIAAARAHGLDILDGPFAQPGDGDRVAFRAECEQGRDLGMDGKSLVHRDQIAICNAIFAPPSDEIMWATKIVSAFAEPANASKSVLKVEGQIVARPQEVVARRTMQLAEAIAAMTWVRT